MILTGLASHGNLNVKAVRGTSRSDKIPDVKFSNTFLLRRPSSMGSLLRFPSIL